MGPSVWGRLVNKHSGTTTAAQQFEPVISIGVSKEKRTPAHTHGRGTLTIRKLILLLETGELYKRKEPVESKSRPPLTLGTDDFRLISVLGRG